MIMNIRRISIAISLVLFFVSLSSAASAFSEDGFIRGYGTAVLVREFGVSPSSLQVEDGVITLSTDEVNPEDLADILSILMTIDGVVRVELVGAAQYQTKSGEASAYPEIDEPDAHSRTETSAGREVPRKKHERLFEPLMADPRWPRFAISYLLFTDNGDLNNIIASAIGGTIPVYEDDHTFPGTWQVAIQAGAFAINDLDTSSWDLLNSDYRFGLAFINRKGSLARLFRVYHFSTHAGDEAILNSGIGREAISYEAVDALFSYDLGKWLRVYGGGAYRFSRNPKGFDPLSFQYGFELKSPRQYLSVLRPVAGANFYTKEENHWRTELSLRLGAEIETQHTIWHKVQFLIGYFNGPSPYGQFLYQSQEYLDFGIHLYF